MSNNDIIRAWKDEEYRNSLSAERRSQLPENPSGKIELSEGKIELSDEELESLSGGMRAQPDDTTTGTGSQASPCQCQGKSKNQ